MNLIFAYGTLRRGEGNAALLRGAPFLGRWVTEPCFTLYSFGAYPGVVDGGDTAIVGEVYSVDSDQLMRIDRLEDYPILYDRRLISSPWGEAWIYLYLGALEGAWPLSSGDWLLSAE